MGILMTALTQTPWWVFLLLFLLVRRGIAAGRPSVAPLWKLAILPLVFLVMDVSGMAQANALAPQGVLLWLAAMLCGALAAGLLMRRITVRADRRAWRLALPGDPLVLPAGLIVFALKYALGYMQASSQGLAASPHFLLISMLASSFFTGIFVGRFCGYLLKFLAARHESLSREPAFRGRVPRR